MLEHYSFEQISLFAKCAISHQVKMLDMVLSPMLGASGVGWKPGKTGSNSKSSEGDKETALLNKLARSPIRVRTVKTSEDKSNKES